MLTLEVFVNLLLLILLVAVVLYFRKRLLQEKILNKLTFGFVIGLLNVVSIILPIEINHFYQLNISPITISLSVLLFGTVSGFVAVVVSFFALFWIKIDILNSLIIILIPFLFGILGKYFKDNIDHNKKTLYHFLIFGFIVSAFSLSAILLRFPKPQLPELINLIIFYLGVLPLSFFIVGYFYLGNEERLELIKKVFKVQERYKLIAENISEIITLLDFKLNILFITPSVEKVLGYSVKELVGTNTKNFFTPDSLKNIENILLNELPKELKEKPIDKIKFVLVSEEYHKNGEIRLIENTASIVSDKNNQPLYIIVISRDVTEKIATEEKLKLSEEKFRKIFSTIPDPVTISDIDTGAYVEVNNRFSELSGYSRDEVIGKTAFDIHIWVNEDERKIFANELKKKGILTGFETRFRTKSGEIVEAEISSVIFELSGKKYIIIISHIISEMKRIMRELDRSRANLKALINNGDESIWSIDKNYNYIVFNDNFRENFVQVYNIEINEGLNALDILPIERKIYWKDKYDFVLSGRKLSFIFTKIFNNNTYYLQIFLSPIYGEDEVTGVSAIGIDITKKRIAEIALEESEKRYKAMFEVNHAPMILLDVETKRIVEANKSAGNLFGMPLEELRMKKITEINLMSEEEIEEKIKAALSGTMEHDFLIRVEDSSIKHVEAFSSVIELKGKEYIYSILIDVTAKVEALLSLEESENKFRLTFETMPDPVIITEMETGKMVDVNKAFEEISGYSKNELIDKTLLDLSLWKNDGERELILEQFRKKGAVKNYKTDIIVKDGKEITVLLSISVVFINHKEHFLTIAKDMTKFYEKEKELLENRRILEFSQKTAHIGSWELNWITNKLSWSDEVYTIFGLKPQEFPATYEAFLERIHPEDKDLVDKGFFNSIKEGKKSIEIEHRIIRKDNNEIRIIYEECKHFRDDNGNLIESLGVVYDITERKKAERELKKLLERLVKSEEIMRKMVADQLHDEVGQNLTALSLNINYLKKLVETTNDNKMYTSIADSSAIVQDTIEQIRNVMYDLRPPVLEQYGLQSAINWALNTFKERSGIETRFYKNLSETGLPKHSEYILFRVFQEALHNIIKHAKADKVDVTLEKDDRKIKLSIVDNGIGFDKEKIEKLKKGYSFGLISMSDKIKLINGTLEIKSEPGKGTKIIIKIAKPINEY